MLLMSYQLSVAVSLVAKLPERTFDKRSACGFMEVSHVDLTDCRSRVALLARQILIDLMILSSVSAIGPWRVRWKPIAGAVTQPS